MNAAPDTSVHHKAQALFADRQPLRWIVAMADQIAREAGLDQTADIEDLVIIAYLGLLDSPHSGDLAAASCSLAAAENSSPGPGSKAPSKKPDPKPSHQATDTHAPDLLPRSSYLSSQDAQSSHRS